MISRGFFGRHYRQKMLTFLNEYENITSKG